MREREKSKKFKTQRRDSSLRGRLTQSDLRCLQAAWSPPCLVAPCWTLCGHWDQLMPPEPTWDAPHASSIWLLVWASDSSDANTDRPEDALQYITTVWWWTALTIHQDTFSSASNTFSHWVERELWLTLWHKPNLKETAFLLVLRTYVVDWRVKTNICGWC